MGGSRASRPAWAWFSDGLYHLADRGQRDRSRSLSPGAHATYFARSRRNQLMTTELFIARPPRPLRSTSVIALVVSGLLALPTALFADGGKTDSTPSNGNLRPALAYQAAISRPINYRVD